MLRFYTLSMGDSLAQAATAQSTFLLEVDRTRGMIYDRNFQPLVGGEAHTVAAVLPSPKANAALAAAVYNDGESFSFDPQASKPYLVQLQDAAIYSVGIEMFDVNKRYGDNQLAPHIIGYLNPEKTSGAAGIELAYESELSRYNGSLQMRYYMDAYGRPFSTMQPEIVRTNYQDAGGIVLTLDAGIQRAAQNAMRDVEKGAAVVLDVQTGDILACVSMPAYDPNDLAASLQDPNSPFVNRAFSQFNVGSTFKLVTAAAALEAGYGRFAPYTCTGSCEVDEHVFNCHWRLGHGEIDLMKAIEVSCNPYFVNLGLTYGGQRIASLARDIGFTRAAEFGGDMKTQSGTISSESELRMATEVANLSFGQGRLTATPVQVAQMICTVANGGYAVTPRLVEGYTQDGKTIDEHTVAYSPVQVFSKSTSDILRETLVNNVENGSGVLAKPVFGGAGGKTASAQTGIYIDAENEETGEEEQVEIVHAWFAGYYPEQNPQYAIVVLVEGGDDGGEIAAPVFKKIADGIYLAQR